MKKVIPVILICTIWAPAFYLGINHVLENRSSSASITDADSDTDSEDKPDVYRVLDECETELKHVKDSRKDFVNDLDKCRKNVEFWKMFTQKCTKNLREITK